MSLKITRAIIDAIHSGEFDTIPFKNVRKNIEDFVVRHIQYGNTHKLCWRRPESSGSS